MATILDGIIRKPEGTMNPIFVVTVVDSKLGIERDTVREFVNPHDIDYTIERDGLNGMTINDGLDFEFCRTSRKIILDMFNRDGLRAKGRVKIYQRGPRFRDDYRVVSDLAIDFSTMRDDLRRQAVMVNAKNAELNDYIGAQRTTNYDIKVTSEGDYVGVAETKKWRYSRMNLINSASFTSLVNSDDPVFLPGGIANYNISLPLYHISSEQIPGSPEHDIKTQRWSRGRDVEDYFFEAESDVTLRVNLDLKFRVRTLGDNYNKLRVGFYVDGEFKEDFGVWEEEVSGEGVHAVGETNISLEAGQKLSFGANIEFPYTATAFVMISAFNNFKLSYTEKGQEVEISVIKPEVLFQRFLDLITGEKNYITCSIEWGLSYEPLLMAAESIRGFVKTDSDGAATDDAYIHSSIGKLFDWLKFMGLGYKYWRNQRLIQFKPRDQFFDTEQLAIVLEEKSVKQLEKVVSDEHVYSTVKVNYPSPDNETTNGRFIVCAPTDFTTGYIDTAGKNYDMKSDYVADPISIELLCWERGKDTTDNRNDNNIYVLAATEQTGHWIEKRDIEILIPEYDIRLFNAYLDPRSIIQRNASVIGISTDKLTFTGTEGYRDAVYVEGNKNGTTIFPDIEITSRLFQPFNYSIEVGNKKILTSNSITEGVVYVKYMGKTYRGFIKEAAENPITKEEQEWELYGID